MVRSAILDGTYPIEGLDPWYCTTATRLKDKPGLFCCRSPRHAPSSQRRCCPSWRRPPISSDKPITTTAPNGRGKRFASPSRHDESSTPCSTATSPLATSERPGRAGAFTEGNERPLARMVAEVEGPSADASAAQDAVSVVPSPKSARAPKVRISHTPAPTTPSCGTSRLGRPQAHSTSAQADSIRTACCSLDDEGMAQSDFFVVQLLHWLAETNGRRAAQTMQAALPQHSRPRSQR